MEKKALFIIANDSILTDLNTECDKQYKELMTRVDELAREADSSKKKFWEAMEARLTALGVLADYNKEKQNLGIEDGVVFMRDDEDMSEGKDKLIRALGKAGLKLSL